MAWWNPKSKPEDTPEFVYGLPGQVIPCDNPEKVVIIPKDPEPDLSTKPKDVVGYCFGYVCPKKHVHAAFESIATDGYKERRVCQECGGVAKPAVIKRIAEAMWGNRAQRGGWDRDPKADWGWYNCHVSSLGLCLWAPLDGTLWTKYEFVHYLETPKRRKK